MRSINRRSFLASSAVAASAVGLGAAMSGTVGAGVANAQGLPLGSSGEVPLPNPGLVGVEAPAGSVDAATQVRFALPEGWSDWLPFPKPDGARDADNSQLRRAVVCARRGASDPAPRALERDGAELQHGRHRARAQVRAPLGAQRAPS